MKFECGNIALPVMWKMPEEIIVCVYSCGDRMQCKMVGRLAQYILIYYPEFGTIYNCFFCLMFVRKAELSCFVNGWSWVCCRRLKRNSIVLSAAADFQSLIPEGIDGLNLEVFYMHIITVMVLQVWTLENVVYTLHIMLGFLQVH